LLALVHRLTLNQLSFRLGLTSIDHAILEHLLRSLNLLWLSLIDHTVLDDLLRSLNLLWLSLIDHAVRNNLLWLLASHNLLRLLLVHYLLRLLVDNLLSREGTVGLVLKEGKVRLRLKVVGSSLSEDFAERVRATHGAQKRKIHKRHACDGCR